MILNDISAENLEKNDDKYVQVKNDANIKYCKAQCFKAIGKDEKSLELLNTVRKEEFKGDDILVYIKCRLQFIDDLINKINNFQIDCKNELDQITCLCERLLPPNHPYMLWCYHCNASHEGNYDDKKNPLNYTNTPS